MAEIINLRQARKDRARVDKEAKAADNRIAFGRPKKANRQDKLKNKGDYHKCNKQGH